MVKLVREIDKALYNPIWEQVRQPAPWDVPGDSWQDRAMAEADAEAAELAADPERAEEARRAQIVCNCKTVSLGEIEDAIAIDGARSIGDVHRLTEASGGCGGCAEIVVDILASGVSSRQAAE